MTRWIVGLLVLAVAVVSLVASVSHGAVFHGKPLTPAQNAQVRGELSR